MSHFYHHCSLLRFKELGWCRGGNVAWPLLSFLWFHSTMYPLHAFLLCVSSSSSTDPTSPELLQVMLHLLNFEGCKHIIIERDFSEWFNFYYSGHRFAPYSHVFVPLIFWYISLGIRQILSMCFILYAWQNDVKCFDVKQMLLSLMIRVGTLKILYTCCDVFVVVVIVTYHIFCNVFNLFRKHSGNFFKFLVFGSGNRTHSNENMKCGAQAW